MHALFHFSTHFVATSWALRFSLDISHEQRRFLAHAHSIPSTGNDSSSCYSLAYPPVLSPYLLFPLLLFCQPLTRHMEVTSIHGGKAVRECVNVYMKGGRKEVECSLQYLGIIPRWACIQMQIQKKTYTVYIIHECI